jgi:hypothetical protein
MDAVLLIVIVAVPCLGLWGVVKGKKKLVRVLGAVLGSLAIGLAAGIFVGMSRAWSGGTGNAAFAYAVGISLLVFVPIALRANKEKTKKNEKEAYPGATANDHSRHDPC